MTHPGRARQEVIYQDGVFGRRPAVPTDFASLERAARKRMSNRAWAYVAGGAGEGVGMAHNRAALDRWAIVPRMLRDTSVRSLSVDLFGRTIPAPLLVAPVGAAGLVHRQADIEIGAAAATVGVPYIFSNQGSAPMEATASEMDQVTTGAPRWFQLYWSTDDDVVDSLIQRAEAIRADALVLTVDTTVLGWRPQDLNLGSLPFSRAIGIDQYTSDPRFADLVASRITAGNRRPVRITLGGLLTLLAISRNAPGRFLRNLASPVPRASVETFLDTYSRPTLNWSDLARLRDKTRLPVVVKGILHPDDARKALDVGVDGIIVSNHGGRQVDGVIGAADALVDVVAAVGDRTTVILDSGIRSGADIFKALALGADAVTVGRPHIYGLTLAGRRGVADVLTNLIAELDLTLALSGFTTVTGLPRDAVRTAG